jgi:hypothetical protein
MSGSHSGFVRFIAIVGVVIIAQFESLPLLHGLKKREAARTSSSDLRQYRGSAYGTRTRDLCLERANLTFRMELDQVVPISKS